MIGQSLGQVAYYSGIRRRVTQENLIRAFPALSKEAARTVSARVYRHFGAVATSLAAIPGLSERALNNWIYVKEFESLREALERGKGCLVFSGHLGNWELMGAIAARCGIPVTFVVTTQRNKQIEALVDGIRRKADIEIVKRREAVRGVLAALKRNRCVAILIDQDAHEDGAFVPFFAHLASTPRGPAVFHLRTGAPLIFAESTRLPGEKYRIRFSRFDSSGISDPDVLTAKMTAMLEAAIRETPEQWFWMHRRWKTLPPKP